MARKIKMTRNQIVELMNRKIDQEMNKRVVIPSLPSKADRLRQHEAYEVALLQNNEQHKRFYEGVVGGLISSEVCIP